MLGAAELERVRDALVVRVREAQTEIARRADVEEANRDLVESMIADPDEHRWVRVSNEDVGERECKHWHSRPRWGILGMLLGWWRVKVSSGCPVSRGRLPLPMSKKRRKRKPRQRVVAPAPAAEPAPPVKRHRGLAAAADDRPPAPWGSFPLVEIAVLVGIVMLLIGLIGGGDRGPLLIGIGLGPRRPGRARACDPRALRRLSLALDAAWPGSRPIAVLALLFYTGPDSLAPLARVGIAAAVFAVSVYGLATMFRRKAGVAIKLR